MTGNMLPKPGEYDHGLRPYKYPELEVFFGMYPATKVVQAVTAGIHSQLLVQVCRMMRAKNIVELGSGTGVGTAALADYCVSVGGHLTSVDIGETIAKSKLGHRPEITFVVSDSVSYADRWQGPVDVVYVDSDHSRRHALNELNGWLRHGPRMFLMDDTLDPNDPHGSPLEAALDFCAQHSWTWCNIPVGTGLAILLPR